MTPEYVAQYGGQTTTCPSCGRPFPIPTTFDPAAAVQAPPPPQPMPLGYAGGQVLPYASPTAPGYGATGFDGVGLVMSKGAVAPDRCVKCNRPTEGYRLRRSLSWHHPALFFLIIFPGLLIYAIVALCVRKTGQVTVGLCPAHRAARRRNMAIAWLTGLIGLGLLIGGPVMASNYRGPGDAPGFAFMVLGGIVLLLFGLIFGATAVPVVTARRIDEHYVYMRKAGRAFLESLPRI